MTNPPGNRPAPPGGDWLYPLLFAVQTLGALIILWKGVPWYSQVARNPATYAASTEGLVLALVSVALIQAGYWTRHRLRPALPRIRNAFLGHVVQFTARMLFVLATVVFALVFFSQRLDSQMPGTRYFLILSLVFSLFCYMKELLQLGSAMEGYVNESES